MATRNEEKNSSLNIDRKENLSLIAAIGENQWYGFSLFRGSIKAQDFGWFILNLIKSHSEIKNDIKSFIFYCDNYSTHKSKAIGTIRKKLNFIFAHPTYLNWIQLREYFHYRNQWLEKKHMKTNGIVERYYKYFKSD